MCLIDSFINFKKSSGKGLRENSIKKYTRELDKFFNYFRELKGIDNEVELVKSISQIDMDDFKNWMADNDYSISSINGITTTCKQFSSYLLARNIIQDDFSKGLKIISKNNRSGIYKKVQTRTIISKEEYNRMIKLSLVRDNQRYMEFNSIRNTFMILILGYTGMRIDSDLLTLKMSDITKENGVVFFNKKAEDTKTGLMDKKLPVVGVSRIYYDKYIELRSKLPYICEEDYLIVSVKGKKLCTKDCNNIWHSLSKRMGKEDMISNHSFRHLFASISNVAGNSKAITNIIGSWAAQDMQEQYIDNVEDEDLIQAIINIENKLLDKRYLRGCPMYEEIELEYGR